MTLVCKKLQSAEFLLAKTKQTGFLSVYSSFSFLSFLCSLGCKIFEYLTMPSYTCDIFCAIDMASFQPIFRSDSVSTRIFDKGAPSSPVPAQCLPCEQSFLSGMAFSIYVVVRAVCHSSQEMKRNNYATLKRHERLRKY